jgi:ADP-L-glycero-D-manno-heptose 6-epimerase
MCISGCERKRSNDINQVVLVTGSKGFIGQKLIQSTIASGHNVGGVDDEYFQTDDWKRSLLSFLNQINPEVVFHVGACSDTLEQDVQFMMIRNYESTKVISDWCTTNNRKLVYSSSAANYGESGLYPSNLYGWSKYAAEDYVINCGGVALRYFNVYGPGEQAKGSMASFLHQAYLMSRSEREIKLFPGSPVRDFVYIEDVVSANIHAYLNYDEIRGRYYEVSTGVAHSFEDKLDIFGLEYTYAEASLIPKGYQFYTCGNPERWMPGWSPNYSLEAGVLDYKAKLEYENKP